MRLPAVLLVLLVVLACLVPSALAGPDDARALGAQLADPDLEVALEAAKRLHALGADANPAVDDLAKALDRRLTEHQRRLQWHPWRGILPEFRLTIVRTLGAIGPDAAVALPRLIADLAAGSRHAVKDLVLAVLAIAPDDPAVFDALCGVISRGRPLQDPELWAHLAPWIEAQGDRVVPALDGLMQSGRAPQREYAAKRLAALGSPGVAVLLRRLESARPNERSLILGVLIASGNLRGGAIQTAIEEFAADSFSGDGPTFALALANAQGDVERPLVRALATSPFSGRAWRDLWGAAPELARRVSRLWVAARTPPTAADAFDAQGLRRTKVIGGGGGGPFEDRLSRRATLTGLRVFVGGWGHRTIVRGVQALFDGPEGRAKGPVRGTADGKGREIRAEAGYAVGGLFVKYGHRVDGLAVLFLRIRPDGGLDPKDGYVSPWIAGVDGALETRTGGTGARIVGLTGRRGADLDAIGLVAADR